MSSLPYRAYHIRSVMELKKRNPSGAYFDVAHPLFRWLHGPSLPEWIISTIFSMADDIARFQSTESFYIATATPGGVVEARVEAILNRRLKRGSPIVMGLAHG